MTQYYTKSEQAGRAALEALHGPGVAGLTLNSPSNWSHRTGVFFFIFGQSCMPSRVGQITPTDRPEYI